MGPGKGSCSSHKFSALIVDDDPVNRRVHRALLSKLGSFEIQIAENGKEAVDLHWAGATFDLILMDMEMPIMDGPEATRSLRAMGVGSMIVGATTRALESEQKEAFMEAGLDHCLPKPLSTQTLLPLIQLLNNK